MLNDCMDIYDSIELGNIKLVRKDECHVTKSRLHMFLRMKWQ